MAGEIVITDSLVRADVWLDTWRHDHERVIVTHELEYDGNDDRIWTIQLTPEQTRMLRGTYADEAKRREWFVTVACQSEQGIIDSAFRPRTTFTPEFSRLTFMLDGEIMSFERVGRHFPIWKYVEEYGA